MGPDSSPHTADMTSASCSSSQPGAESDGPGKCRAGRPDLPGPPWTRRRCCAMWAGGAAEQLSCPALRRGAAAGGHCPGAGQKPQAAAVRRAHGALDYVTGKSILKLLQDTCRQQGMTVVVITHNSAIAPMADQVIHVKNGRVERIDHNDARSPWRPLSGNASTKCDFVKKNTKGEEENSPCPKKAPAAADRRGPGGSEHPQPLPLPAGPLRPGGVLPGRTAGHCPRHEGDR